MIKCSSQQGLCPPPPLLSCRIDYRTLLSPRVEREIVFEQNAKRYNFERWFLFFYQPLSLNPSSFCTQFYKVFSISPHPNPLLKERENCYVTNLFPYFLDQSLSQPQSKDTQFHKAQPSFRLFS